MTETIGFIGLGVLGSAMAGNLVKDGFAVVGFDAKARTLEDTFMQITRGITR